MITTNQEFDAAIDEAFRCLDAKPVHGSAEDHRLVRLLDEIRSYHPDAATEQPQSRADAERLMSRVLELRNRIAHEHDPAWYNGLTHAFQGIGNSVTGQH